jgi:hypothetical protein
MHRLLLTPLAVLGFTLMLSSCATAPAPTEQGFAPVSCELPAVIEAFNQRLDGAAFIPTEWQPAEGTDLYDVYEAGGIACTYGIESAEIGGTVMWAPASDELWLEKSRQWKAAGYVAVDITDVDEHEALVLESVAADGQAVWFINFHIGGVWIQFGASKFITNLDDALEIVQAAALVTKSN